MVSHSLDVDVDERDGEGKGFPHAVSVQLGRKGEIVVSRVPSAVYIPNLSLICSQTLNLKLRQYEWSRKL